MVFQIARVPLWGFHLFEPQPFKQKYFVALGGSIYMNKTLRLTSDTMVLSCLHLITTYGGRLKVTAGKVPFWNQSPCSPAMAAGTAAPRNFKTLSFCLASVTHRIRIGPIGRTPSKPIGGLVSLKGSPKTGNLTEQQKWPPGNLSGRRFAPQ